VAVGVDQLPVDRARHSHRGQRFCSRGNNSFEWIDRDALLYPSGSTGNDLQFIRPGSGWDTIQAGAPATACVSPSTIDVGGLARVTMQQPLGDSENNNYRQLTKFNGNGTVQGTDSIVGVDN